MPSRICCDIGRHDEDVDCDLRYAASSAGELLRSFEVERVAIAMLLYDLLHEAGASVGGRGQLEMAQPIGIACSLHVVSDPSWSATSVTSRAAIATGPLLSYMATDRQAVHGGAPN